MSVRLHTDIDPYCCAVLRARVEDGSLPPADVLCADVRELGWETIAKYSHIDLFAGIGGSPLGLLWAGWPDDLSIVTGGFPCQDISYAGKGAGLDGARSGLFWETIRVIDIARPDWVLVENVGALSTRGLRRVADAMGQVGGGYGIHAFRVGAWAAGSPQRRERWWIVAHAIGGGPIARAGGSRKEAAARLGRDQPGDGGDRGRMGDPAGARLEGQRPHAGSKKEPQSRRAMPPGRWPHKLWVDAEGEAVPTPQYEWEPPRLYPGSRVMNARWRLALMGFPTDWMDLPDTAVKGLLDERKAGTRYRGPEHRARWANKQGIRATGNAQVPQCVAAIAGAIVDAAVEGAAL